MRKAADENINNKLAGLEAAQSQIREQVAELRATVEKNAIALKQNAEETTQSFDLFRKILDSMMSKKTDTNKGVSEMP